MGPDGWGVSEEEAEQAIQQQEQNPITPVQWAKEIVQQHPLILDTETTGLDPARDEIIELALIELDGSVAIDTFIQSRQPIPIEATAIHGITDDMLQGKPTFPEVWERLAPYLSRPIIIYNAAYDIPMLAYNALRYKIRMPRPQAHCLMTHYTEYSVGADGPYQKLEVACRQFQIQVGIHRAISDAEATRQVLLQLSQADMVDLPI
jgi:DNA polymerase-3 subunit epsilon